nr:hypothetical protein [Pedobacter sp. ASV19]
MALDHISRVMVYGFIVLFVGAVLLYWISRRRFNRRNKYGVPQYKNYEHKTVLLVWENVVKLCGQVLVLAGVLLTLLGWLNSH